MKSSELKAYCLIRERVLDTGQSPTLREVADHVGFRSTSGAHSLVNRLQSQGLLRRTPHDKLGLRLVDEAALPLDLEIEVLRERNRELEEENAGLLARLLGRTA